MHQPLRLRIFDDFLLIVTRHPSSYPFTSSTLEVPSGKFLKVATKAFKLLLHISFVIPYNFSNHGQFNSIEFTNFATLEKLLKFITKVMEVFHIYEFTFSCSCASLSVYFLRIIRQIHRLVK